MNTIPHPVEMSMIRASSIPERRKRKKKKKGKWKMENGKVWDENGIK